jgi:hypothetical protein
MSPRRIGFHVVLVAAIVLLVSSVRVSGQATWGAIAGFVTDQSGAAVPQAKITVTNEKTGVSTDALTDAGGLYNVTHLEPGVYAVSVEAKGFRRFEEQHIVLRADSTVRVDPKLQIGELLQQVTVTAEIAQLKTEKTDVDRVISQEEIADIPLPGQNVTRIYLTAPGVSMASLQIGRHENPSEGLLNAVNGQLWLANDFQMDGISNNAWGWSNLQILVPPKDAIQELKVTTSNYDPEYGSIGGMVAQYVTRSGTNTLHGSAYWYNQNDATFAADPFTEKVANTGPEGKGWGPSPYNENIGGGSLGGPLKKNKMFLFGSYRLDRRRIGARVITTVPNDAFRIGDFSARATSNPIFDPTTGNADGTGRTQFIASSDPLNSNYNAACTNPAGCLNMIPTSRINSVGTNLLKLLPRPNLSQATELNYLAFGKGQFDRDQIDTRYDWNISDANKLFLRYSFMWSHMYNPSIFGEGGGAGISGSPTTADTRNHLASLNFTHTFSPSLLGEFRLGFSLFVLDVWQNDLELRTAEKVGIPGINTGDPTTGGLGEITVGGPVGNFSMGTAGSIPRLDRATMLQFANNWTKLSANHQFRWGFDVRRNREDLFTLAANTRGRFWFNQTTTGALGVSGSGISTASFLLGAPSQMQRGMFILFPSELATRAALYGGDTWRITPKLTVNYGVRWDYFQAIHPRKPGGAVNLDFNTGELILAGLGDVSMSSNSRLARGNVAPRLGLAYRLTEKTVLRAGLGRSYFLNGFDAAFNHLTTSYPLAQAQNINQATLYRPIFPIQQGPPTPPAPQFPSSGRLTPPPGTYIKAWESERKIPSLDSWNFSIERRLAPDLSVTVAYVGNKGTHLDYSWFNFNSAPPGPGSLITRRPYYQKFGIDGDIYLESNCDDSNYHALQIVATKRFGGSYGFNSSFTWAKALDNQIGNRGPQAYNPYDRHASHGVSFTNRAVEWTLTHSVQVPYGHGRRYGANAPGVVEAVLGGWKLDGLTTVGSGMARSPTDGYTATLNAGFSQRPNRVSGVPMYPDEQTPARWFNPAAFAHVPVCCAWGDAGAGILRGPGLASVDWSIGKEFRFSERTQLEFRWENFNIFNTDINSVNVGRITALTSSMRRMQFGLHLRW